MQQQWGVGGGASKHMPYQVGQAMANLVVENGSMESE
jgi:hypothetical protein